MRWPRFSIARLMMAVLMVAVSFAALRSQSTIWSGVMLLLTHGILALGIVGVIVRRGTARNWWLGYVVFGVGYLWLATGLHGDRLPTGAAVYGLLNAIGAPIRPTNAKWTGSSELTDLELIMHSIWMLVVALIGGLLASRIFAIGRGTAGEAAAEECSGACRSGRWLAAVLGGSIVLILAIAAICPRSRPELSTGCVYLLTWGALGLVVLGAGCGSGPRRSRWIGAALFGLVYMMLIFVDTGIADFSAHGASREIGNGLLNSLQEWVLPIPARVVGGRESEIEANERVQTALDQSVPMHFPDETPLDSLLDYIRESVRLPDGQTMPIYVDPAGLTEAEKTMSSLVTIDLEGVPLRKTLQLALKQLGMRYYINGGVVEITSDYGLDPFYVFGTHYLVVGHCLLSLLAASLGGLLAPLVASPRGKSEPPAIHS